MVCGDGLRRHSFVLADGASLAARLRALRAPLLIIVPAWFVMMAAVYVVTWRWREVVF
jgi:hypothetical protein